MDMRGKLSADSQSNSAENVMGMFLIKQRKSPKKTFTKIRVARKELFHEDREKDGRTEGGETDTNEKSEGTKLIVAFRKCPNGPNKKHLLPNLIMSQIYYFQNETFMLPK
jgi:hypothetical protein